MASNQQNRLEVVEVDVAEEINEDINSLDEQVPDHADTEDKDEPEQDEIAASLEDSQPEVIGLLMEDQVPIKFP